MTEFLTALFLGFIEGLTEFIPVSSTGHLVILVDWLGFAAPPGRVFEVFIQLGAIMAVVVLYRKKLIETVIGLPSKKKARRFALNLVVATIPAIIAGSLAHGWIKSLYTPAVIGSTLFLGGIILLVMEQRFKHDKIEAVDDVPLKAAFLIGCFQMLALIPGVSRSGATIMGALALGLKRPAAAEFSFFLAIPVMFAAVSYDIFMNWNMLLHYDDLHLLLIGFFTAFLTAMAVLKLAIRLITRWGFAPFAWYRIGAGLLILIFFI
jgi:undecaprenyl-diphosphatase